MKNRTNSILSEKFTDPLSEMTEQQSAGDHIIMKEMSETERPYEKSYKYGVEVLSDAELLAVILRTGSQRANALTTAYRILDAHPIHKGIVGLNYLTTGDLEDIEGVGKVKAVQMKCLAEISRRMASATLKPFMSFHSPQSIAQGCAHIGGNCQQFYAFTTGGVCAGSEIRSSIHNTCTQSSLRGSYTERRGHRYNIQDIRGGKYDRD